MKTDRRTRSVAQQDRSVNRYRLRARYIARRKAIDDRRLNRGMVTTYLRIDDADGGCEGMAYIQQATLARMLGYSEVWVRRCLRRLEKLGYLRTIRGQRGVRYVLLWIEQIPTETPVSRSGVCIKSVGSYKERERRLPCAPPVSHIPAAVSEGCVSPAEVEALLRERGCRM